VSLGAAVLNTTIADRSVALDVGDVVALDPLWRCFQVEGLGERGEHRLGPAPVVVRLDPQLLQLLLRSLRQLGDKGALAATLRYLDGHRPGATLAEPTRHQIGLVELAREDHHRGTCVALA
jgi:hypothetical protein